MEPVSLPAIPRMALCGGTHGNELSGVYLVREWQRRKVKKEAELIDVVTVIANPRAVQQCRRYIEKDLNRCFTSATLSIPLSDETPYEIARAHELNALLGPRGSDRAMDLICDLHNTTANMGLSLITNSDCDWISLHIYKHVQKKMSSLPVRLINLNRTPDEAYDLASVAIEIGPQPHGLVRADILSSMKEGVQIILEWIRLFNSGTVFEGGVVEVYTVAKNIDYPRDPETQDLTAVIHPQLQVFFAVIQHQFDQIKQLTQKVLEPDSKDCDFCLLCPGDPLFLSFSGETLVYEEEEPLHAIFVNESAYYEKGTALTLTRKKSVEIPPLRMKKPVEEE